MSKVFIIAESATTWLHGGLEAAYTSIKESKACGADAWKTQWCSDPVAMHKRRGIEGDHYKRLAWPVEWLSLLKAKCDEVGIEFMCTVYLPKDIEVIAPLVERFKVSVYERRDDAPGSLLSLLKLQGKPILVSSNGKPTRSAYTQDLYCVSEYPTPFERLRLSNLWSMTYDEFDYVGLSDHTESTLTGAVAVGAGATILEKHVKLWTTPESDPDFGHSLYLDSDGGFEDGKSFYEYVRLVREAEKML